MDINEIAKQENLLNIVKATLEPAWRRRYSHELEISFSPKHGRSQRWMMDRRLACFYTGAVSGQGRSFMADRFRFTPNKIRLPLQWIYGSLLASRWKLRRNEEAFFVTPPISDASKLVVVPGNRRIRVFHFGEGTTTSFLKTGYSRDAITNELTIRTSSAGPFPEVLSYDLEEGWFEEEILPGYALPRVPPWWRRRVLEHAALRRVDSWVRESSRQRDHADYVAQVRDSAAEALERFTERYPDHRHIVDIKWASVLAVAASAIGPLTVASTHGDLQPGNIHVTPEGHLYLLDWEFADVRQLNYDFLTYGLRVRYPVGLSERIGDYVAHGRAGVASLFISDLVSVADRKRFMSLYLLEEIARATQASVSSPYDQPPEGYLLFCAELWDWLASY